jgi:uncharacterized repeat protein (TIGR03843 family)
MADLAAGADANARVCALLATASLRTRGFLANASNHTLLVQVGEAQLGLHAVYKPRTGERPLWDFPRGTLCQREVAAYVVSEALGWALVPPTVLRDDAPMGPGSLQLFVPHDPDEHYFTLVEDPSTHDALVRLALFDLLTNNADRKASHVLRTDDGWIYGCDHGLTFHVEPKLRTVIWDVEGSEIPNQWRGDLRRVADALSDEEGAVIAALRGLLDAEEIAALGHRARMLGHLRSLPDTDPSQRPYPWPPL